MLFVLLTAMVSSMVLIPIMIRLAPHLGMVDKPDPRKVHSVPIPRVGGVGIVLGSLLGIGIWLPFDGFISSFIAASLVLFIFGALDDSFELGHYVKFIGQFIAVGIIIVGGDVWIHSVPFFDAPLSPGTGKVFTVFAMVGMINAINHSDGLDGLAGGESLLSICCIAFLAYMVDGTELVIFSMAVLGGILGFMRFNNHPAQIFMGDSGSQFLGFTLATLTIVLTQKVHTALSMALPVLILGLPVIDIISVFIQRIYNGMNWFRATKNHIHHRLLELKFDHYQSVVIIYSIQTLFVLSAVIFKYEMDYLIIAIYFLTTTLIFSLLIAAERMGWTITSGNSYSALIEKVNQFRNNKLFSDGFLWFLKYSIPLYFIVSSLALTNVTNDFAVESVVVISLLAIAWIVRYTTVADYFQRAGIYTVAVVLAYLLEKQGVINEGIPAYIDTAFFTILALIIFIVARYARQVNFAITPFDYLMLILVLVAGVTQQNTDDNVFIASIVVKSVILFYGCEIIINNMKARAKNILVISSVIASTVLLAKSTIM